MKNLKSRLLIAATLTSASMAALGAAGSFDLVTIESFQTNVTYSETSSSLQTYAGFHVSGFSNINTKNTINDVVITFEVSVINKVDDNEVLADEKLSFYSSQSYLSVLPENCNVPAVFSNPLTITCAYKQVKAGQFIFPAFTVFYNSPVKINDAIPDYIKTKHTITYAEGTNDCANGCSNSIQPVYGELVLLGTANPTIVKSGVPDGGTKIIFTGNGASANSNDKFSTNVTVPPLALGTYTIAEIEESQLDDQSNCNNFGVCWQTSLTIPGTFSPFLEVVLTMDKSNIKPGTKIESVLIDYEGHDVGLCAASGTPRNDGVPCINDRRHFKSRSVPGWTPDLDGDMRWWLISKNNGLIRLK